MYFFAHIHVFVCARMCLAGVHSLRLCALKNENLRPRRHARSKLLSTHVCSATAYCGSAFASLTQRKAPALPTVLYERA